MSKNISKDKFRVMISEMEQSTMKDNQKCNIKCLSNHLVHQTIDGLPLNLPVSFFLSPSPRSVVFIKDSNNWSSLLK